MQAPQRQGRNPASAADRDWWRGAVIYQIYPRSYQDTDGDGIGDLKGITSRLGYIAALGVDAIWISPFFKSPMRDFGYDVSDYRDVDPMFGTLADFEALVAEAHRLGLKVMIDEVISHTADDHPWFVESRSSRNNAKADWYVWADAKADGTPPNNWLSIFGGSAWQWDTRRQQYYLHNFLSEQPDLNFHNPAVQDALLDVTRFWLERGVDGFRLDTINFYFHSQGLEDNPPLPPGQRNDQTAPSVNPYNYQDHIYDKSRPENLGFLERFRALLDEYPAAAAVGEVGDSQRGLEVVAAYTAAAGKRVHMCYAFDFLAPEKISAAKVRAVLEAFAKTASDGWSCWAFSNHDVVRHASRWAAGEADLRNRHVGLLQQMSGACQPEVHVVFQRRTADMALEQALQVPRRNPGGLGKLRRRNRVFEPLFHQPDDSAQPGVAQGHSARQRGAGGFLYLPDRGIDQLLGDLAGKRWPMHVLDETQHQVDGRSAACGRVAVPVDDIGGMAEDDLRELLGKAGFVLPVDGGALAVEQARLRQRIGCGAQAPYGYAMHRLAAQPVDYGPG